MNRIVVGLGGSAESEDALIWSAAFATACCAEVVLVLVDESSAE